MSCACQKETNPPPAASGSIFPRVIIERLTEFATPRQFLEVIPAIGHVNPRRTRAPRGAPPIDNSRTWQRRFPSMMMRFYHFRFRFAK